MTIARLAALLAVAATPLAAQDTHFTRQIPAGATVEIENINGSVDVTPTSGRVADVTVTKTVKRGNGALVKAIMEEDGDGIRVCTIYLNRDPERHTCRGDNNDGEHHGDELDVQMHYVVHLPAGARIKVDAVNGNVSVTGIDAEASLETVNGTIDFDGATASKLETVNGRITARFGRAMWDGTMRLSTVNGAIEVTLPESANADLHATTVNGGLHSDFPITMTGTWGPKSMDGKIGTGGRRLALETVNGGITITKR